MTSNRPQIIIPPRSTAMIPPGHVKHTLLHLFDVGSPSRMTLKEKRDTFRTLQKYLTVEIGKHFKAVLRVNIYYLVWFHF